MTQCAMCKAAQRKDTHRSRRFFLLPSLLCRFGIPTDVIDNGVSNHGGNLLTSDGCAHGCSISMQSERADVLRAASLVVWDEGTVNDKEAFHVVDNLLRDVMRSKVCQTHFTTHVRLGYMINIEQRGPK